MLGRLKTFVFGDTACGVAGQSMNNTANNSITQIARPQSQRMTRTKRKRDDTNININDKDLRNVGVDYGSNGRGSGDEEPAAKKAEVDNPDTLILTPVSDALPFVAAAEDGHATFARKRRRGFSSPNEESPLKRMRQEWDALMDRPFIDYTEQSTLSEDHTRHSSKEARLGRIEDMPLVLDGDAPSSGASEEEISNVGGDAVADNVTCGLATITQQYRMATPGTYRILPSSAA